MPSGASVTIDNRLDRWEPYHGKCFCGHPDARHRLWAAWVERYEGGGSIEELSEDYCAPIGYIAAVLSIRPYIEEI